MNRYMTLIIALLLTVSTQAQKRISHEYNNVSLSDALRQLAEQQTGYTIYFLYNELEDFRITINVKNKHLPEAIQQMIGFYPIRVTTSTDEDGRKIFVECTHKTARRLTGTIIDEQGQPIAYANVAILNPADSTLLSGGVSNESGYFAIPYEQDKVLARISYVGYKTIYKICSQSELGVIRLQVDNYALKGVTVKGSIPTHKLTAEGLQTNVENTILSKLGTANDVLAHIPGLQKNGDDYSVFGKGTPIFYINGRLVRNQTELDQLKSENIKSIVLVTSPGSRYDASVRAVVKIKTKLPQGEGFSFDNRLVYGQSENADLIEQLNINYRHRGLDAFGMLYFSSSEGFNRADIEQDIQADTIWHQSNTNDYNYRHKWLGGEAGLNYVINDENSIGFRYNIYQQLNTDEYDTFTSILTANGKPCDKLNNSSTFQNRATPMHSANVYYNGVLGKTTIDFNADWKQTDKTYNSAYTETSENFGNRLLNTSSHIKNRLYAAKLVVGHQLLGGNLDIGGEYTNTHRNDDYVNPEGYLSSNFIELKDQNMAIFADYTHKIPIGTVMAGLRYEHASFDYYANGCYMKEQSRTFDNIFPSLSMTAQIGKVQGLVSYTAKIRRPNYSELNGNMSYANRFTLQVGNPFLKPSIIHNISLQAMWKIWSLSADYTDTRNDIIDWTEQQEGNTAVSILGKKNIKSLKNVSAYLVAAPKAGFWHPQFVVGLSKQWLTLQTASGSIRMNAPIFLGQMANTFQFTSTLIGDLTMKFTSKGDDKNISLMRNMFQTNISLTKTFFEQRLSIRLAGYDLFHARQKIKLYNQQMQLVQDNSLDTRYAEITIRYNFNATRSKYKGTGAGNAEKNRL